MQLADAIAPNQYHSLHELFIARVKQSPRRIAYRWYDDLTESWVETSWQDVLKRIAIWKKVLSGYQVGERVVVALPNGVEWIACEQAAMSFGLIVVPVSIDDTVARIEFFIRDSRAKLLVVDHPDRISHWQKMSFFLPADIDLVCVDRAAAGGIRQLRTTPNAAITTFKNAANDPFAQPIATLVYTSGTTGSPKGVLLSHRNIIAILNNVKTALPVFESDQFFSTQSLASITERTIVFYLAILFGNVVVIPRSMGDETIFTDIKSNQPQVIVSTPHFFRTALELASVNSVFARIARHMLQFAKRRQVLFFSRIVTRISSLLIRPSLKKIFGNQLRLAVCGSAPVDPEIIEMYRRCGIVLRQGYGLTEASPVVTLDISGEDARTVGQACGVEIKLSATNEILVRGDNVMVGYWGNVSSPIDSDGWLHTGDIGRTDGKDWFVLGRKENILVLANGQKYDVSSLRETVMLDPLFSDVNFSGHESASLVATVRINSNLWRGFCNQIRMPVDERNIQFHPRVKRALLTRINVILARHLSGAKIDDVKLVADDVEVNEKRTGSAFQSTTVRANK